MSKLAPVDGFELVKLLCNKFGFVSVRQKGSHVTLKSGSICVTVPLKKIGTGLLLRILKDSGIDKNEYLKFG